MRSVVTAASRMLFGAQHSAVTRCMTFSPSAAGCTVFMWRSCMAGALELRYTRAPTSTYD